MLEETCCNTYMETQALIGNNRRTTYKSVEVCRAVLFCTDLV